MRHPSLCSRSGNGKDPQGIADKMPLTEIWGFLSFFIEFFLDYWYNVG
jgi:hypothetical protein